MLFLTSSFCLQALAEIVRCGSFSQAAKSLCITQPALSVRIRQLEDAVGHQLIQRSRKGVVLTPSGRRLLDYINLREVIDQEISRDLGTDKNTELSGCVRIAGHYSSIVHTIVPALAKLLREHPRIELSTMIREDDDVPGLLEQGECDFAIVQVPIQNDAYQAYFLGEERYVLVQSKRFRTRNEVYIDSHISDVITQKFFNQQPKSKHPSSYRRSFLHNETGIARAVALGIGRAVVAEKEVFLTPGLEQVSGFKPLLLPNFLQCSKQVDRSRLFSSVKSILIDNKHHFS